MVNAAWHAFMLIPVLYQQYCGGSIIDHDPRLAADCDRHTRQLLVTKTLYQEIVPEDLWTSYVSDIESGAIERGNVGKMVGDYCHDC